MYGGTLSQLHTVTSGARQNDHSGGGRDNHSRPEQVTHVDQKRRTGRRLDTRCASIRLAYVSFMLLFERLDIVLTHFCAESALRFGAKHRADVENGVETEAFGHHQHLQKNYHCSWHKYNSMHVVQKL